MSDFSSLTPQQWQALMQYAGKRLGADPQELVRTVREQGAEGVLSRLSPGDTTKIEAVLGDRDHLDQWLRSPQIQQVLRQLSGR